MQAKRTPVERKYALTKIRAGDYLLPSNDATRLWRIRSYVDGPSGGLDWPTDKTFWLLYRWDALLTEAEMEHIDPENWDRWEVYDSGYESRAEAIAAALKDDH